MCILNHYLLAFGAHRLFACVRSVFLLRNWRSSFVLSPISFAISLYTFYIHFYYVSNVQFRCVWVLHFQCFLLLLFFSFFVCLFVCLFIVVIVCITLNISTIILQLLFSLELYSFLAAIYFMCTHIFFPIVPALHILLLLSMWRRLQKTPRYLSVFLPIWFDDANRICFFSSPSIAFYIFTNLKVLRHFPDIFGSFR